MKTRLLLCLLFSAVLFCTVSCTDSNNTSKEEMVSSETESSEYNLDKSVIYADVNYLIDSSWEILYSNSSGDEYKLLDNVILHLWYQEPLAGSTAEQTLFDNSNPENDLIFTDNTFEYHSEKARRIEKYTTNTVGGKEHEYYASIISFIRNDKIFHITILGDKSQQEICHSIIEAVFSSITFTN